jgi:hypothetical protein
MRRSHATQDGSAMARQTVHLRRVGGPRKSRLRMRWRPILFFVVLVALVTLAGIMREDALRKMTYTQSHSSQDVRR